MTYHAAPYRSGPALYLTAFAATASIVLALGALTSVLCAGLHNPAVGAFGEVCMIGLLFAAPIAIVMSLVVRCHACNRLVIPLVYDGKTLFASGGPNAFAIGRVALAVVVRGHAACPHCGAEAQV
jgi:hypothetical protein